MKCSLAIATIVIVASNAIMASIFFLTLSQSHHHTQTALSRAAQGLRASSLEVRQEEPPTGTQESVPAPRPVQETQKVPNAVVPCQEERRPAQPRPPGLVMGMAANLPLVNVYRFVRSLKESCVDCSLVLFVEQTSPEFRDMVNAFDVRLVVFDPERDLREPAWRKYHPSSYRWLLMRDYLERLNFQWRHHRSPYHVSDPRTGVEEAADQLWSVFWPRGVDERFPARGVFFADVRDAVFQTDVFEHIPEGEEGIWAFQEARPHTIQGCGWNSGWVSDCFGRKALMEVGSKIISCSGTTLATWHAALSYVRTMAAELETNSCERNGVDQGMHNYFLYTGKLLGRFDPEVDVGAQTQHIVSNEDGFVATVQNMRHIQLDPYGRVVNNQKEIVSVVHQYDRSKELENRIDKRYPLLSASERTIKK